MTTYPDDLLFGQAFRVSKKNGAALIATFLQRLRGGGAMARLAAGQVERLNGRKLDWSSCARIPRNDAPDPLAVGDMLRLRTAAGVMRGELAQPIVIGSDEVVITLYGQAVPLQAAQITECALEFRTTDVGTDDVFVVQSKSGNAYEGVVKQVLPDGRLMVELRSGKTVDVRLDRLDLNSYVALIDVPLARLWMPPEDVAAEDLGDDEDLDPDQVDAETAKRELRRARASTARLKRALLQQQQELSKVRDERRKLESEVATREKALESEVWRGLAANRDLSEMKKKLRDLEEGTAGGD